MYDVAAQHVVSGAMEGVNGNYDLLFLFSIFFDIDLEEWWFKEHQEIHAALVHVIYMYIHAHMYVVIYDGIRY